MTLSLSSKNCFPITKNWLRALKKKESNLSNKQLFSSYKGRVFCVLNALAYSAQLGLDPFHHLIKTILLLFKTFSSLIFPSGKQKLLSELKCNLFKIADAYFNVAFSPLANLLIINKFLLGIFHPGICYRQTTKSEAKFLTHIDHLKRISQNIGSSVVDEYIENSSVCQSTEQRLNLIHDISLAEREKFLKIKLYPV